MKTIKKILPKKNEDIDFDALTQKIRLEKKVEKVFAEPAEDAEKPKREVKAIAKTPKPVKELKKAGRKKTNTEEIHRFAMDIPLWLFEQIRKDADDNFSTVRGQILKLLLNHYKNVR